MKPLAVYVHIPFCFLKCHYCDFNAFGGRSALEPLYFDALLADLDSWRDLLGERRVVSVYFGGGTPGDTPPASLAAILDAVRALAGDWDPDVEVGLEANPATMPDGYLPALVRAGFSRVSFGVQSFDPSDLQFLDRVHSPEAAAAAVLAARCAGFEHVNVDLMYGLPGQTLASWRATVERAASLPIDHVSCYALTVEEGTRLARWVTAGLVRLPEADSTADQYELAAELLAERGFAQYELSNWARPGGISRHNLCYWTDGEYLGVGAGAHGYVGGVRYETIAHPRAYIAALLSSRGAGAMSGRPAVARGERPGVRTALLDWVTLRLRLVEGFGEQEFAARFGRTFAECFGPAVEELRAAGVLDATGGRVRLTERGRLLHSEAVARLAAALD
jgi:oxygen-independent coproporphyrinogen-3 oxidase